MTPYLLDTNILTRLFVPADPQHVPVRAALRTLWLRGDTRHYAPQNLVEFWNVCTRPVAARGGLGLSPLEADRRTQLVERLFTLLPDDPSVHILWRQIIVTLRVSGVQVHDARLVAFMRVYGITHLLTLNTTDFARYSDIVTVHPASV